MFSFFPESLDGDASDASLDLINIRQYLEILSEYSKSKGYPISNLKH